LFVAGTIRYNAANCICRPVDLVGWPVVVAGLMLATSVLATFQSSHRVGNLMVFVYLLFTLYAAAWIGRQIRVGRDVRIVGVLLLSLAALASRNVKDLTISALQAPAYRQALNERMKTLQFHRIPWPLSYIPGDVTPDATFWINGCVARYYRVVSVSCMTCAPPPSSSSSTMPVAASAPRSTPPCGSREVAIGQ
jgi:hypothetical protein